MKAHAPALLAVLAALPLHPGHRAPIAVQETDEPAQDEPDPDDLPPYQRFLVTERKRLAEGIEGNWILLEFEDPNSPVGDEVVDGWASFNEGYLTMFVQLTAVESGLLRQVRRRYIEVAAHRYQFSQDLWLQTAAILGVTNMNDGDLENEPAGNPREFQVELSESELLLVTRSGNRLTFRRMEESRFPFEAALELQETR